MPTVTSQIERECVCVFLLSQSAWRGSTGPYFYEASWEQPWFLSGATCHQLLLLYLVPANLTHLLKVQTSTYITLITLLTISGLEDFTNLTSSSVIKGMELLAWGLSQKKQFHEGFPWHFLWPQVWKEAASRMNKVGVEEGRE